MFFLFSNKKEIEKSFHIDSLEEYKNFLENIINNWFKKERTTKHIYEILKDFDRKTPFTLNVFEKKIFDLIIKSLDKEADIYHKYQLLKENIIYLDSLSEKTLDNIKTNIYKKNEKYQTLVLDFCFGFEIIKAKLDYKKEAYEYKICNLINLDKNFEENIIKLNIYKSNSFKRFALDIYSDKFIKSPSIISFLNILLLPKYLKNTNQTYLLFFIKTFKKALLHNDIEDKVLFELLFLFLKDYNKYALINFVVENKNDKYISKINDLYKKNNEWFSDKFMIIIYLIVNDITNEKDIVKYSSLIKEIITYYWNDYNILSGILNIKNIRNFISEYEIRDIMSNIRDLETKEETKNILIEQNYKLNELQENQKKKLNELQEKQEKKIDELQNEINIANSRISTTRSEIDNLRNRLHY